MDHPRQPWKDSLLVRGLVIIIGAGALFLFGQRFMKQQTQPHLPRDLSSMRSLQSALEAYFVDHGAYPMYAEGAQGANGFLKPAQSAFSIPTFRIWANGNERFATLTTPISYVTRYLLSDYPAHDSKHATYGYYTTSTQWILFTAGPDGKYDLDPRKVFTPSSNAHSPEIIVLLYDPSNGTFSRGDLIRCKE